MFKIQKHKIGRYNTVRLINDLTKEYLEVLTDFGAGLNNLTVKNSQGQLVSVIDGYRSEEEIVNDHDTAFKGSKLSPFPNRIPEGIYQFEDNTYQLPVNEVEANNNLHALLHDKPFEILEETVNESEAILILGYNYKEEDEGYPFNYDLTLTYKLSERGVSVNTVIENRDLSAIPMADGWHPYFRFENLDNVQMQMGAADRTSSNFGNKLNGVHGFEHSKSIGEEKLDDCFEAKADGQFAIQLVDKENGLGLEVWQECTAKKYKYFQIYTPPSRKTIAIEPVTCVPNAFNNGEGLIILEPNEKVSMSFGIKTYY